MTLRRKKNDILLESGTNEVEFLRFFINSQFFGLNVGKIRQVIEYDEELRQLLMICEFNQFLISFVVDKLKDILRCTWKDVVPFMIDSKTSTRVNVTGNIVYQNEITPIFDVEAILADLVPYAGIAKESEEISSLANTSLLNKTVVYCEDSPTVQRVLMKCLNDLGVCKVHWFASGLEGLEFISKQPTNSVDMIISDIEMPKMDGLTLCREVRKIQQLGQTPFVFFSSMVTEEMRDKCTQVGGNAAFSKPELKSLSGYIANYCQK
jgi:two-component system, chemotaxis family, chemotaxis protein CheV